MSKLLIASALGRLFQVDFGQVGGIVLVVGLALFGLFGQTTADKVVLLGGAALTGAQLCKKKMACLTPFLPI